MSEDTNIFENFFVFFEYLPCLPLGNFKSLLLINAPTFVFFTPAIDHGSVLTFYKKYVLYKYSKIFACPSYLVCPESMASSSVPSLIDTGIPASFHMFPTTSPGLISSMIR